MQKNLKSSTFSVLATALFVLSGVLFATPAHAQKVSNVCPVSPLIAQSNQNFVENTMRRDGYGSIGQFYIYNPSRCTVTVNAVRFSLNTTYNVPLIKNISVTNLTTGSAFGSVVPAPMTGPLHLISFVVPRTSGITIPPFGMAHLDVKALVEFTAPTGPNIFALQLYQFSGVNTTLSMPYNKNVPAGTLPVILSNWFTII